ncbi:MAG: site-specific DNA-methyltransferase [Prevotella sp.]|nr:site-specific DNA-methyltransferase [Prevotella sp.]
MDNLKLYLGNCLDILPSIKDGSVDCIICDPPYGVTNRGSDAGKWDVVIPFEPMWEQFLRVTKENAAIVLFGSGMFSAKVMLSKPNIWKYNLIWSKSNPSGFLNANRMPLREHEDIMVFYRKQPTFNPQMKPCSKEEVVHGRGRLGKPITNSCYGKRIEMASKVRTEKCPTSILHFPKPHHKGQHPTEKSVDLCRWLIRSYSNKGDLILDPTMGSGTTGVAAVLEGRGFIGIEKDEKWYNVARSRLEEAKNITRQEYLFK